MTHGTSYSYFQTSSLAAQVVGVDLTIEYKHHGKQNLTADALSRACFMAFSKPSGISSQACMMSWLLIQNSQVLQDYAVKATPKSSLYHSKSVVVKETKTCGSGPTSLDSNYLGGVP